MQTEIIGICIFYWGRSQWVCLRKDKACGTFALSVLSGMKSGKGRAESKGVCKKFVGKEVASAGLRRMFMRVLGYQASSGTCNEIGLRLAFGIPNVRVERLVYIFVIPRF